MRQIDLSECLDAKSDVLIGYEFGQRVRERFKMDSLDRNPDRIRVILPTRLDVIAPSFAQGFFGESVLRLGREGFFRRYDFSSWPPDMLMQVETGVLRALMDRDKVVAA